MILFSSSWRVAFDNAAAFASAIGVYPLADLADIFHRDWCTEWKFSSNRAQEIGWWLHEHPGVTRYAVLDDHDVFRSWPERAAHLVRTDAAVGVTHADLVRVRRLLCVGRRSF